MPHRQNHTWRVLAGGAVVILVATACAASPDRSSSPSGLGQSSAPRATASPETSPQATTLMPADVEAASLGWQPIGSFPPFHLSGVLGFAAGYVAFGTTYETGAPGAFYSRDGTSWSPVDLANQCDGGNVGGGLLVQSLGATDGRSVVLLGRACGWSTWTSHDGISWQHAVVRDAQSFDGNVWPTPSGWELLLESDTNTVLRSDDGVTWRVVSHPDFVSVGCCPKAAASPDGTRVIGDHLGLLVQSDDGATWRDVPPPYEAPTPGGSDTLRSDWLSAILPAGVQSGAPWVLFTIRHDGEPASTWSSHDLEAWDPGIIPMSGIAHAASTRLGFFVTGMNACTGSGDLRAGRAACPPETRTQFHSPDGSTWTALGSSVHALGIADGPAGVIAIGRSPGDTPALTVWHVASGTEVSPTASAYTDAELDLLFSMRADLQVDCAPLRSDLPAGTVAAVECRPDTRLIDRVGSYQFSSDREAAGAYLERLAENGIPPMSGDCLSGSGGDHAWTPGDDAITEVEDGHIEFGGHILVTSRFGCFVNDVGFANVRVICGGGLYVGVLGNDDDLAELMRAAMRAPPGTPISTPMAPGICAGP